MELIAVPDTFGTRYNRLVCVSVAATIMILIKILIVRLKQLIWLTICIAIFKACKSGYTGINCEIKCFFPLYGDDCQSTCNCTKDECDPIHGCRNLSGKTVVNICNGCVVRSYIRNNLILINHMWEFAFNNDDFFIIYLFFLLLKNKWKLLL